MTNGTGGDGRTGALHGLTVLDLTGPEGQPCGRILADLGADVILIEPPSGSPSRRMAPFAHGEAGPDRSLFFVHFNTNKRGITLDLNATTDRPKSSLSWPKLPMWCWNPATRARWKRAAWAMTISPQ